MKDWLTNSELVIFDLDGTLYEGTDHFDYYATHLMNKLPKEKHASFWDDYTKMKEGEHAVSIGKAYDVVEDRVLTIDPFTLEVQTVQMWDGSVLDDEDIVNGYSTPLTFDFERMIAIGDGWWYPFVTAKHYGVEDCYSSYVATKEYMVTEAFELVPLQGLREGLLKLKEHTPIVLVTNSDEEDVARLLQELQLDRVFDHVITSAKKPSRTLDLFKQLSNEYSVPFEGMVSVGDNFINEIAPAIGLGMVGVYIHPQGNKGQDEPQLKTISSVTDLFSN